VVDPEEMLRTSMRRSLKNDRWNEVLVRLLGDERVTLRQPSRVSSEGVPFFDPPADGNVLRRVRGNEAIVAERLPGVLDDATLATYLDSFADDALDLVDVEGMGGLGNTDPLLGLFEMPKEYAAMVRALDGSDRLGIANSRTLGVFGRYMDWSVGLLLASSVEVVAHSSRILGLLSRTPGVGNDLGLMSQVGQFIVPHFGPRLGGLTAIANAALTTEGRQMAGRIARVGGASTRALQTGTELFDGPVAALAAAGKTKIAKRLEFGRDFLFGQAELGSRSLFGFDERARIAAATSINRITRRELGRDMTDAELRSFVEGFGKYNTELLSRWAEFFRKSKINPFISGQVGIIPREVSQLFGGAGLPSTVREELGRVAEARLRTEAMYRGVVGTFMSAYLVQRAATGTNIWENDDPFAIKIGYTSDGRAVEIPWSTYAPGTFRALNITATRTVIEAFGGEELSTGNKIFNEAALRAANTAIGYGLNAPGLGAATAAALGRRPFITGSGELLQVAPPQPTLSFTLKARAMASIGAMNPTIEELFGFTQHSAESPLAIRFVNAFTTGVRVGRTPELAKTQDIRVARAQLFEIANTQVSRALRAHPDDAAKRRTIYEVEAAKFQTDAERATVLRSMLQTDRSRRISLQKNVRRVERGRGPFP